jgi:hypothetical protein
MLKYIFNFGKFKFFQTLSISLKIFLNTPELIYPKSCLKIQVKIGLPHPHIRVTYVTLPSLFVSHLLCPPLPPPPSAEAWTPDSAVAPAPPPQAKFICHQWRVQAFNLYPRLNIPNKLMRWLPACLASVPLGAPPSHTALQTIGTSILFNFPFNCLKTEHT